MDSLKRIKDLTLQFSTWLTQKRKLNLNGVFSISLDADGVSFAYIKHNGDEFELQAVGSIPCTDTDLQLVLSNLVLKYQLKTAACSWLLASDKYHVIQIDELPVPPEEFQSAVRWQIKKLLSFSIEDAFIDSFPIPPAQIANPKKYTQVVAAQASYIQPIADKILESGLNLTKIDILELSLRNISALFENNDDRSTALVYLQEKSSVITITRQGLFYFSRKLEWSLNLFIEKSKEVEQAQEYMDKLALELHRSFDYFQGQWRYPAPARILIAPEKSTTLDIAAYLSQRLTLTIQNLNLNSMIRSKISLDTDIQGKYLALLGAALCKEAVYEAAN